MPYILYIYLRIFASFGVFAFPLIIIQFGVLIRMIMLINKYKLLKVENKADKKEKIVIIAYGILAAILWLPLIVLSILADIKA